jgi:RNA polymerase sigma-70 factor (ECF subfamily)
VLAVDANSNPGPAAVFATTHWSVVLEAGENESAGSSAALEKLCRNYWRPIYSYVRRRGHAPHEAEDLTQAFFAHFLERKLLSVVDRQRGRFRTFVLHACEYFLAKEWRNATRLKRGGGHQIISLDAAEDWYQNEPADQMTPERLYERQWALSLLELALERLRQEWVAAGKSTLFATLQIFLSGEPRNGGTVGADRRQQGAAVLQRLLTGAARGPQRCEIGSVVERAAAGRAGNRRSPSPSRLR